MLHMFRSPKDDVNVPNLYNDLIGPLTAQTVFLWYTKRSEEIECVSSLADHSMTLLEAGVQRGVPLGIYCANMELLIDTIYRIGRVDVNIRNILDQPINHLIDFILAKSSHSFIVNDLINYAVPYITKLCGLLEMDGLTRHCLINEFILDKAKMDLTPLHLCLKQSFEVSEESPLALIPFSARLPLVMECFKVCKAPTGWSELTDSFLALFTGKNQPRDALDHVYLGKKLSQHVEDTSLFDIYQICQSYEQSLAMLERLFHCAGNDGTAPELLLDLVDEVGMVCDTVLCKVMSEQCYTIFARAMLGSGVKANIMLTDSIKSHVPYEEWSKMLASSCKQYIDSAVDIKDDSITHARSIIELAGTGTLSNEELLLSTLEQLRELGVLIPPMKFRDKQYHTLWLEEAVRATPKNYLKEKKLSKLAKTLKKSQSYVQMLIATAAFGDSKFHVAKAACEKCIAAGSQGIWKICLALGTCKNYLNRTARREMLEIALRYCLPEQVDDLMVLHKELSDAPIAPPPPPTPADAPPFYPHFSRGDDVGAYTLAEVQQLYTDQSDESLCSAAKQTLYRDSWLTTVILLQLNDPDNLDKFQSSLPTDDLYAICVCLVVAAIRITNTPLHSIGSVQEVVKEALEMGTHKWSTVLNAISRRITDTLQGRVLKEVNGSINVPRFTHDVKYRKQSIIALARSHDLQLPLSLADRYNMGRWDVYFAHFTWLLTDPNISDINALAQSISENLLTNCPEFILRSKAEIYPYIDGTNHVQLACYYGMLRRAGCYESEQHSRVLKKLRAAVPGLDYKILISSSSPLPILAPLLNSNNVHVVAKNSSFLGLSSSSLFLTHFMKLFWVGEGKTEMSYDQKWDRIYKDINHLTDEDKKRMILHFCLDAAPDDRSRVPLTLKLKIASGLPHLTAHLKSLECEIFRKEEGYVYESYAATEGANEIIESISMSMFLGSDNYMDLEPFLAASNTRLTAQDVLEECVDMIINRLLGVVSDVPPTTLISTSGHVCTVPCYDKLYWFLNVTAEELLCNMLRNMKSDTQPALVLLRPFCSDLSLPFNPRSQVMSIIERECDLSSSDTSLILFYKTSAIMTPLWSRNITLEHISTPDARHDLCLELCDSCNGLEQCRGVSDIMVLWGTNNGDCVVALIAAIARLEPPERDLTALEVFKVHHVHLSQTQTTQCSSLFSSTISQKLLLLSDHSILYHDVIDELSENPHQDAEVLSLLCLRQLIPHLVNTRIYPYLVEHVLAQDKKTIRKCARELREAGYNVEAASLTARAMPSAYNTLNSALRLMKHWTS